MQTQTSGVYSKGNTPKFWPKVTHPLLIWALGDIRSQIAAEWLQIAQRSQGKPIGNHHCSFKWCHRWPPRTSPFAPKWGFHMPQIREWPYLRNGWSDTLHVWFSRVGFSGSADRMALFPVTSKPSWRQAAILNNFEWPYLRNDSFDPLI